MGGVMDAGLWGAALTMFAAAAGVGLTVAAMALVRRAVNTDQLEFDGGYNALAPQLERYAGS